jgi:hypothetical protein
LLSSLEIRNGRFEPPFEQISLPSVMQGASKLHPRTTLLEKVDALVEHR